MLPNQKASIDRNLVELIGAVESIAPILICYLEIRGLISQSERDLIDNEVISSAKLTRLFHILKANDSSWSHLQSYLRANHQSCLADKLQSDADGNGADNISKRSALEEFSVHLAQYYQLHYANVPTMWESPKHVKDVWVPLQIDSRKEEFLEADSIDYLELLNRLKSTPGRNVALIKGDPGMGKTTLAKKIAFDWAVNYNSTDVQQQFSLVLAVPLRYAGKLISGKFDLSAINYFLSILDLKNIDRAELIRETNQLESRLLVILEGLDEYNVEGLSILKVMFSSGDGHSYSLRPPPMINFKLIITSRPYACEHVNEDFYPLRFVLLPLEVNRLGDFVKLYCQTSHAVAKVNDYLKANAKLVIQVPLILTFICYLADSVQDIPTNITTLYDSFLRQMLSRAVRLQQLEETVNMQKWRDSKVVKATSALAYSARSGFKSDYLEICQVTNDSFICGYLLHKFDFNNDRRIAEFPHRSIQEFFVALHCFQLINSGNNDELKEVKKLILSEGGQIGRFLLGMCSNERQFDQITNWLRPSLISDSSEFYPFEPITVIDRFGASLIDCNPEENRLIGQMLFESVGLLEDKLIDSWDQYFSVAPLLRFDQFTEDFKKALHICALTRDHNGDISDWCLADQRSARLQVVFCRQLPETKFDHLDVLILGSTRSYLTAIDRKNIFDQISSIPSVRTLVLATGVMDPLTSFTACIRYRQPLKAQLINFRFEFANADRCELLGILEKEMLIDLTVEEQLEHKQDSSKTFKKLRVIVNDAICQATLIYSLIRLSLESD